MEILIYLIFAGSQSNQVLANILPIICQKYEPLHCLLPRSQFYVNHLYDSTDPLLWLQLRNESMFEFMQLKYRIMYAELVNDGI